MNKDYINKETEDMSKKEYQDEGTIIYEEDIDDTQDDEQEEYNEDDEKTEYPEDEESDDNEQVEGNEN